MTSIKRTFDIPYHQLVNFPLEDALCSKVNKEWKKITTQDYINQANLISKALLKLGLQKGDKVAMVSNNRFEWNIMDIGMAQIGVINIPVYPTISESDYNFIFNNAEVKLCFVSNEDLFKKINSIKDDVSSLSDIYSFEKLDGVKNWTELLDLGKDGDQEKVDEIKDSIEEDELVTMIYTSGTTGNPKGVMLTHKNLVSNVMACIPRIPIEAGTYKKSLSFLPVCHVYERMLLYLYQVQGIAIYFAESIETISDNLKEVKPEVFTAVPRLLEKVYDKIIDKGSDLKGIKKALFFWAVSLGEKFPDDGVPKGFYASKLKIAQKIIFSKWKEALGGNVKVVASGSAALNPKLARVFNAANIPVMEGYGLTETSPVIAVNCFDDGGFRIGSVGAPLSNVEVKIENDGEICVKGPNVMVGYYKNDEKTKEVFTEDGFFRTGDIGHLSKEGYLFITDRKKEMFKTSGGKYIAPQLLENYFKESRFIETIMVVGENRKHPAAIVSLDLNHVKNYFKHKKLQFNSIDEAINNEVLIKKVKREIDHYNKQFGKWEQVKKIKLVPDTWSVETGELTPTLKLKRKVIKAKYADLIEEIYN